jgi:pimeloyl-ACP methyl ester carboxylesterase
MVEWKRLPNWTRILLAFLGLLTLLTLGFVIWGSTPAKPMPEALTALQSDSTVIVETGKWLVFTPASSHPTTGFIIYPGGRVDYRAYSPSARQIAEHDYLVVIVHVPLNLAVLNPAAATDVIASFPNIQHWVLGGHSLGGSMAATFVHSHPGMIQGLVLWASYPAGSDNLSSTGIKVLSISGMLDGLSTPTKIESSRALLPTDTIFVKIEGGNHAQFGWYGPQPGDNPATISTENQQNQIIQATLDFLSGLK